jgi:hypothetical protein
LIPELLDEREILIRVDPTGYDTKIPGSLTQPPLETLPAKNLAFARYLKPALTGVIAL